MPNQPTRVERFIRWLNDNRVTSILIILGILVIAVASFTDAVSKLVKTTSPLWSSPTIPPRPSPLPSEGTIRTPQAPEAPSPLTFEEYFATYFKLSERFFEKDEWQRSLLGVQVTWVGSVDSVGARGSDEVSLFMSPPGQSHSLERASVVFGAEMRSKLYALRRGDMVRVTGIIKAAGPWPDLQGLSLQLLHGGPTPEPAATIQAK